MLELKYFPVRPDGLYIGKLSFSEIVNSDNSPEKKFQIILVYPDGEHWGQTTSNVTLPNESEFNLPDLLKTLNKQISEMYLRVATINFGKTNG